MQEKETRIIDLGYIGQEKIKTKDGTILYKSLFMTADKKMLIYWLLEPINLEVELPSIQLELEERVSNEGKLELKVSKVLIP